MQLKEIRNKVERLKGQRSQLRKSIKDTRLKVKALGEQIQDIEKAQAVLQTVAQLTQEKLKYKISELTTLALAAVFNDPYELEVVFEIKRNRSEATIYFKKGGDLINPLTSSGIGAVDVASYALRVTGWGLSPVRTAPILILDEPFKHLKGLRENERVIQMTKDISDRMGLQVIMVSDERVPIETIENGADNIINVTQKKGVSYVQY